ncbi:MAG: hypothetical protein Q9221_000702 [Calogaya cf. arnoldii]
MFDLSKETRVRQSSTFQLVQLKIQRWRSENNDEWYQKLIEICNQGYWSRLWVTQEFLKAQSIVFWIGDDQFPGIAFWSLVAESVDPGCIYPAWEIRERIKESGAYALYKLRSSLYEMPSSLSGEDESFLRDLERPLCEVVLQHCLKDCWDWHDKVYGILSLVQSGDQFPIDYSSSKVDLLMAVVHFQIDVDWPLTWNACLLLTEVLDIPDTALLHYHRTCKTGDTTKRWSTVGLSLHTVVGGHAITIKVCPDYVFEANHGELMPYEIFEFEANHGELMPGDEIYEFEANHGELESGLDPFLVFRPSLNIEGGYRLLGALHKEPIGGRFFLHSLPELDPPYILEAHLNAVHNLGYRKRLLLDIDPPTLCFFIRTLI